MIGEVGTWDPAVDVMQIAWPLPPLPDVINFAAPVLAPAPIRGQNQIVPAAAANAANAPVGIPDILALIQIESQYRFPILIRVVDIEVSLIAPVAGGAYPWDIPPVAAGAAEPAAIVGLTFYTIVITDYTWASLRMALNARVICARPLRLIEGQIGPYNPATQWCPSMRILDELDIATWIASAKSAHLPTPIRLRVTHHRGGGLADTPPIGYVPNPPLNLGIAPPAPPPLGPGVMPKPPPCV